MAVKTVLVCVCGCEQGEHHVGKKACKHCPECPRFRLAEEMPAAAAEPVPAEDLAAVADAVVAKLGEGDPESLNRSASARLAEVERERDEARAAVADVEEERRLTAAQRDELEQARDDLAATVDRLQERLGESSDLLTAKRAELEQAERDLATAREALDEYASLYSVAVGERDDARGEASELSARLAAANGRIRDLACDVERLTAQLTHAEQYARDLQDNGDVPPGDVIQDVDAWWCLGPDGCGNRYSRASATTDHPHQLTLVRVITYRIGATTA